MHKRQTVTLLIILSLLLVSCAEKQPESSGTPTTDTSAGASVSASAEESAQPSEAEQSENSDEEAVQLFLSEEPSAAQVGLYLTENAASLTPGEGDLLLERLILLQEDMADLLNVLIWDPVYMAALNETMGGVFDPSVIDDIEDTDVKSAFSQAGDAIMTVVRYEETPVFEMDWNQLAEISSAFSAESADMIMYRSRIQSSYYAGDPLDFDALAADIDAVEKNLAVLDGGFVRWELRKVFSSQISLFFVGPEGSFIGEYEDAESIFNQRLEEYGELYDGRFGELCLKLTEMNGEDSQTFMDTVYGALIFPPDYPLSAEFAISEEEGAWLSLPVITGEDTVLTVQLNSVIHDTALTLVKDDRTDQSVSTYVTVSGDYMSVTFACSYLDENGQYYYTETGLMLDLTTGEAITLDELVGAPFDSYKDMLLDVMSGDNIPSELSPTFAFSLTDSGMTISLPSEEDGWPDYYKVTFNGLRSFMDISQLY